MSSIGSKGIAEFMKLAEDTLRAKDPVNVCFSGAPGLGKSALVEAWAKENGYKYLDLRLAQMEAPDVRGLQRVVKGSKKLEYFLPSMWPESGKVVINFDEINRAPRSNINAVLSLLQERRIGDLTISPEAILVACINEGSEYDINELDPAVRDRLMFVPVEYNHNEFLEYATAKNFHPHILAFLRANLWVYRTPAQLGDKKYLSNRSFSRFNSAYSSAPTEAMKTKVVQMELGIDLAKTFFAFLAEMRPITLKDFGVDEADAFKRLSETGTRPDLLASLVVEMNAAKAGIDVLPLYGRIMEKLPMDLNVLVWYGQIKLRDQEPLKDGEAPLDYIKTTLSNPLFSLVPVEFRDRVRAAVKASDEAAVGGK